MGPPVLRSDMDLKLGLMWSRSSKSAKLSLLGSLVEPNMMSLRTPAEASMPLLGLNMMGLPKLEVTLMSITASCDG